MKKSELQKICKGIISDMLERYDGNDSEYHYLHGYIGCMLHSEMISLSEFYKYADIISEKNMAAMENYDHDGGKH